MKRSLLIIFLLSCLLRAQTADEAVGLLERASGPGVRAQVFGPASVASDYEYSALFWNPAGLAMAKTTQFTAAISNLEYTNSATYLSTITDDSRTFTRFRHVGLVYPFPTSRGSLVIALGYQKHKDLDSYLNFSGFNTNSNGLQILEADDQYYNFDSNIQQEQNVVNEGYLSSWSFGGAIDLSENFSAGLSLNILGGKSDFKSEYLQTDIDNLYNQYPTDYHYYTYHQEIQSEYSGVEFKAGGLFRLSDHLRLGAGITFPASLTVNETWSEGDEIGYDDPGYDPSVYEDGPNDWEYKIEIPFQFSAGMAFENERILLAAGAEYRNWQQTRFSADVDADLQDENSYFESDFQPTLNYAGAGTLKLLDDALQIFAGYQFQPSPLKNSSDLDKNIYGGGLLYQIDDNTRLDISYTSANFKNISRYDLTAYWDTEEKIETNTVLVGLTFNF